VEIDERDRRISELENEVTQLRALLAAPRSGGRHLRRDSQLQAIADSVDQMIWSTRPDGYHDYYNRRWYEYTGMPLGSTDGEAWNGMFHPADQDRAWEVWRHCLASGEPYHIEYRLRHRSGEYRWVLGRAQPLRDREGRIVRWFGTCTDIHDLKEAEAALRQSEDRLRLATEAAAIGTWDYNPVSGELRWDARCKALFGLSADADVTFEDSFVKGLHPEDRQRALESVAAALEPSGLGAYDIEYRTIGLEDGIERWVAATGGGIFEGGRAIRFIGTVRDISARKRAERALADSEAAFREQSRMLEILNRTAGQVAAELDVDRLVQTVVEAGVELTGARFGAFFYNVETDEGESYTLYALAGAEREAFEGFPMPRATALFAPTFRGEGPIRSDDIRKDPRYGSNEPYHGMPPGHLPVTSYLTQPVVSRSGEVIGGLFFGHENEAVFTEEAERLMGGLAAQAAVGIDNARLYQSVQRANRLLEARVEERTLERDRLWEQSEDLLVTADYENTLIRVSPSWTRKLGHTEADLLSRPYGDLLHPEDAGAIRGKLAEMRASGAVMTIEHRLKAADGSWRWMSWKLVPDPDGTRLHGVGRDMTEQMEQQKALAEAEEQLRQSQKMETVGHLTGGIAHDFNNLLQIVTGNLDILLRRLPEDATQHRRYADNARTGARRAAVLTQRLLAFSRRQPLVPKPVEVNRLISGMLDLLHRTLGETIEITTRFSSDLWRVEVDPNQLENAILNLAVNARDAMPDGGGMMVETLNTRLDAAYAARHADVEEGDYVVVRVSDSGTGMSEETVLRAFEPFYTTKEVGKGTGLGLSMVYGFVKQSGGHVNIRSEPGSGTSISVYLPRLEGVAAQAEEVATLSSPALARSETVLVCEDDDGVRAFSVEVLKDLGYRVLEATDGSETLELMQHHLGEIDLLFTDVVLPGGMTGETLAARALAMAPDLKVLYTTGYARDSIVHHGRLDTGIELLTKPFTYTELASRVRQVLDGKG
jgi:PAS domain S-box-containing protein